MLKWTRDKAVIFERGPDALITGSENDIHANGSLWLQNLNKSEAGKYKPEIFEDGRSKGSLKAITLCVLGRWPLTASPSSAVTLKSWPNLSPPPAQILSRSPEWIIRVKEKQQNLSALSVRWEVPLFLKMPCLLFDFTSSQKRKRNLNIWKYFFKFLLLEYNTNYKKIQQPLFRSLEVDCFHCNESLMMIFSSFLPATRRHWVQMVSEQQGCARKDQGHFDILKWQIGGRETVYLHRPQSCQPWERRACSLHLRTRIWWASCTSSHGLKSVMS